jgi:organic radical activating enzyme
MKNLGLYFTQEDYQQLAGPDWPAYQDYIAGTAQSSSEIQTEIDGYARMYINDGIKFPIKTATACQSKWTWSTLWLNRLASSSCHRVDPVPFDVNDFDTFHNLPKKLEDRRLMLNGGWPQGGCEYCQHIEQAGGHSDRQHNLEIRGLTPPELETDPTAIAVTPRIVEIFAQNTCNLACIYCNGTLSSRIEQESIKFGEFNQNGVKIPVIDIPTQATKEYFDRFLSWLDKNIQQLKRLHLLGGETFLQHELMNSVLDIIDQRPNSELEFCIFSNMNVPDSIWNRYTARIQDLQKRGHIKVFDLTASIDCWGPEQEYVRSGIDLYKFLERFKWAASQGPWLRLNINQTITAMTIRTMPELLAIVNQYNQQKHIGHYFEFAIHEPHQHPQIFNWDFWAKDFERIFSVMPMDTNEQQEARIRLEGLAQQLRQVKQHDFVKIGQLHTYLDELDRRRNTNWRAVFPYLDIRQ